MRRKRVDVLGIPVDTYTPEQILNISKMYIKEKKPSYIVALNAEKIMTALKDKELKKIITNADLIIPDGIGVCWAAKLLHNINIDRIAGIDLMENLLKEANKEKYKIFLFGAKQKVNELVIKNTKQKHSKIKICGNFHGYPNKTEEKKIINLIEKSKPDILFVALGAPKQEKWIHGNFKILKVPLSIGVGGSFDVLAGRVKRAPKKYQELGLEWLYRFFQMPICRLSRTLLKIEFGVKVLFHKIST